ncbi:reverse transcriptase domain-containing protein [Tanacetum coccineum]
MANVTSLLTNLCNNFKDSAFTSRPGTLPSQTVTNPRQQINAITTRSGKTLEGPSTPLVPTPDVSNSQKEPEQNPETSTEKVQNPNLENIAHVPPPEEEESIFMEIPKPKAKKPKLGLEALTPTRMTLELANRSITHPMGIADDVVVRVNGFTFLADFVVVNFEPDPRVPIILGRPFLRTAKALIDLYEETLILRVGKEELVYYDPFSGITTIHSDDPSPISSPVKTSDNFEKFADELAPRDSLPPGNDDSTLKKDLHKENFQDHSNPLFEFDDNFKSSTINPLFDEMEEDVEIKNSNVSDEPVLLNTPLPDKEGYFDSEGDITFLDNLLSNDASHNLASEVISDHDPEQNESSITFSPRSDPLHHELAGELLTLPSGNDREFEKYLSLMTVLCEISTSQSQENVHANQNSVIESLPVSPIPVEDSEPAQEEIDIFPVPDDLNPPGVENDDSEDEDNELPNLDHQDDPSIPRPPPEPPDVEKCFEPEAGILIIKVFKGVSKPHDFMANILPTLPTLVSDLTFILFLSSFLSFGSEDTIFDPVIFT